MRRINGQYERFNYQIISNENQKLAVILPGKGYTVQAPLLYYATKSFFQNGYDVLHINYPYTDEEFSSISYEDFAKDLLNVIKEVNHNYDDLVLCAKSIGTMALPHMINKIKPSYTVWLTPILTANHVFEHLKTTTNSGLVFIGDNDPYYNEARFARLKENPQLKLLLFEGADHSMEVPDVAASLNALKEISTSLNHYIKKVGGPSMATEKQKFFEQFNQAFMTGDIDFILESVTDDVQWEMVGDDTIEGKENLREALSGMKVNDSFELSIRHVITHGITASVNGVITFTTDEGDIKKYGFCDVYKLNSFKSGKIKELTSYVVEMP